MDAIAATELSSKSSPFSDSAKLYRGPILINRPDDKLHAQSIIIHSDVSELSGKEVDFDNTAGVSKMATVPKTVEVPHIAEIPHPRRIISSLNIASSIPTMTSLDILPVRWTAADLTYLTSILYPDLAIQSSLLFPPPLSTHSNLQPPIHLHLYIRLPASPIPPYAFSKDLPIGTGRPVPQFRIASSSPGCLSMEEARKSLAHALLISPSNALYVAAKYNMLAGLYVCSGDVLTSVKRGIHAMARVPVEELWSRSSQMQGLVDESWVFEARLEYFLLGAAMSDWKGLLESVEVGLELDKGDREEWASVYREAGRFLGRAHLEPGAI